LVRRVPVSEEVARFAVRLVAASRPNREGSPPYVNEWVEWGAGTRAAQNLILAGKARALLEGRAHVAEEDVRALALPVLRHRILVNFRAEAEGVTVAQVIDHLLSR
jgi:MoxR-like ATPase